ncbi:hypothetical protein CAB08_18550 [Vibrio cholerae]|nr:hypothetical protein [Vibrio cholerae]
MFKGNRKINPQMDQTTWSSRLLKFCKSVLLIENAANKRLKRDCQRVAFPVPMSRGGYGCCV